MKIFVNFLSAFRLLAGFIVAAFAFVGSWLPAFCFVLAGFLSDLIDGPLARKFHVETKGGKVLDLTVDILFDECVIGALFLLGKISLPVEILMAVVIVCLRFPVIFESKKVLVGAGFIACTIYSPTMFWLIGKHYALPALGSKGLTYLVASAVPIGFLIIFFKRERVMNDLRKAVQAFLSKS